MFVSVFAQHRIKQLSFSINGSIEVTPLAAYLDIRLIQVPGRTKGSATFTTEVGANERCKPKLPDTNGFVTDLEPSLQQKFSTITKTEFISQTPENSE